MGRHDLALALAVVAASTATSCGGTEPAQRPLGQTRTVANDAERLAPSPGWVRRYCRTARRAVRRRVVCPSILPDGFAPTVNLSKLRPLYYEYLLEGGVGYHWVFGAFVGKDPRWLRRVYDGFRVLGHARVHHRRALIVAMSQASGIFAGHQAVMWREGGVLYVSSMHSASEPLSAHKTELLAVARGFR